MVDPGVYEMRVFATAILFLGMIRSSLAAPEICVRDVLGVYDPKDIEVCETFVESGNGTPRELATALVNLGHNERFGHKPDGSPGSARDLWQRAASVDPTFAEPHVQLGNLELTGRPSQGVALL